MINFMVNINNRFVGNIRVRKYILAERVLEHMCHKCFGFVVAKRMQISEGACSFILFYLLFDKRLRKYILLKSSVGIRIKTSFCLVVGK